MGDVLTAEGLREVLGSCRLRAHWERLKGCVALYDRKGECSQNIGGGDSFVKEAHTFYESFDAVLGGEKDRNVVLRMYESLDTTLNSRADFFKAYGQLCAGVEGSV